MDLAVLVVNAGSASLKLSLVAEDESAERVESFAAVPAQVAAVAHRIVHGGARFREPVVIDDEVERELSALTELAPLHNTPAIRAIEESRRVLPDIPHVAVFDTAFHATLPAEASTYALPRRWREEWGIRRYGFHGLSVQWAAEKVSVPRLVVCHLGGGCSVTAVRDGRSVETTMGFTPLEGVPMATRPGSIDPEIVLYLLRHELASAAEIEDTLERKSGLLGLSEASARVEQLELAEDPDARLALDVFCYRVASAVGALTVPLGGLDALVFTAGVGEGSASVRERVCERLAHLGVELDPESNRAADGDAEISAPGAAVRIVVVRAREDLIAARAVRAVL